MVNIVDLDPTRVSIEKRGGVYRNRLRTQDGRLISVIACRPIRGYKGATRWLLKPVEDECRLTVLVARLNLECDAFKDMFTISPIGRPAAIYLQDSDPRLQLGTRLIDLRDFCKAIEEV